MVAPIIAGARAAAGNTTSKVAGGGRFAKLSGLPTKHKKKIPVYVAAAMLTVAAILDLAGVFLGLIPIIGTLLLTKMITIVAIPTFGIWFLLCGVSLLSGKRVGLKVISAAGAVVIEVIPFLDLLPGIFVGVLGIIIATWLEEGFVKAPLPRLTMPSIKVGGPRRMEPAETRG